MALIDPVEITSFSNGPRTVSILGSTGSIGRSTVDLLNRNSEDFNVVALTANTNVELLVKQALLLKPDLAIIRDTSKYQILKDGLEGSGIELMSGDDSVIEAASRSADIVIAAIVGAAGLRPTLSAISQGTIVAIANKECLVCAGDIIIEEANNCNSMILPIDSEHNAIFQVLESNNTDEVERIILTASGGPFLNWSRARMSTITPEQAVSHPNWDMGRKVSVDSATLMNKGLELIEAAYLFPVLPEKLEVLVHPQSIIHSMVEYVDGSVLAQMASPDMRTPIAYSLSWPKRIKTPTKKLDFAEIGKLTFETPDIERFPALSMARDSLNKGNGSTTVLNAANEVAVHSFLQSSIDFLSITRIIEETLTKVDGYPIKSLYDCEQLDNESRRVAQAVVKKEL